jgi:hypothetical protein
LAKRVEQLGVDSQPIIKAAWETNIYPIPRRKIAAWSVYLSNYEVTDGEDKEGGERGGTWHSWPHSERRKERDEV